MKLLLVIALLFGRVLSSTAEPVESKEAAAPKLPQPPNAWLGLQVTKPDASLTAQVPSLPPGIGFVIRSVDPGGPAQAAGLRESDLLSKLGDQWLVNEGQLAALLRLAKPDDEIVLSVFRAGKPLEVKLKLGVAAGAMRPLSGELVDAAILHGECGGPMRVINVAERIATYATAEGRAAVWREGEIYHVKIHGPQDELLYEGALPGDGSLEKIPESWRRRVQALRRGLDHALDGHLVPSRQAQPRVVTPTVKNP